MAGAVLAGAFTVMPFFKYPPNPPGVGEPSTLAERQWKYLALIFLSLVVLAAAARLSGWLRERGWFAEARLVAVALAVGGAARRPLCRAPGELRPDRHAGQPAVALPDRLAVREPAAVDARCTVGFGAAAVRRERELAGPVAEGAADGAFRPATSA